MLTTHGTKNQMDKVKELMNILKFETTSYPGTKALDQLAKMATTGNKPVPKSKCKIEFLLILLVKKYNNIT